jgi:tetratricopeptide (TPR) repeat protein
MTRPAALQLAIQAHRHGRLEEAGVLYAEARSQEPVDAEILHLSGVLEFQRGRFTLALGFFDQSLALDARRAEAHVGRGNALLELKEPGAALASYEAALRIQQNSLDAHFNRGNAFLDLGRFTEAISCFETARDLDPTFAPALNNLGLALAAEGNLEGAIASFEAALAQDPGYLEAWLSKGNAQMTQQDFRAALKSYDAALLVQPDAAGAHLGRGNALAQLHDFEGAKSSLERALLLMPDHAPAHCNLANVLAQQRDLDAAKVSYGRALELDPHFSPAALNWGNACLEAGDLEGAVAAFEQAIALAPNSAEARNNLGLAWMRLQRPQAARGCFDRALALEPHFARAHVNRAMLALLTGDFEQGWSEYEWRWRLHDTSFVAQRRASAAPLWLGAERLAGKTLLLHAEQGFGDTLQFCRYAPLAAQMGARVILEVPAPLVELLRTLDGVHSVFTSGSDARHDLQAPLMSLPLAFKTTLSSIPNRVPYLAVDARRVQHFASLLGPKVRPRVALVWSGGVRSRDLEPWSVDERRNIRFETLLRALPTGLEILSLQKGTAESELHGSAAAMGVPVRDLSAHLHDFADTAAALHHVDVLVSVDTAVAHLAGALGKPTLLLNRFDTCWRWLLDRDDSPWYPAVRLYRQAHRGDWSEVLKRITRELASRF